MMIKKHVSLLAAAVATASAQAAFDEGNAILFAYDSTDNDTFFLDLGVTGQQLVDGATVNVTSAGLSAFLSSNPGSEWTVIASVNDTDVVGGAPAAGASLLNSGVVGSSTTGSAVGTDGTTNDQQRATMNGWIADMQAAAGGLQEFSVAGTDPVSSDSARNGGFFNGSLIGVDATANLYYSQANPADSTTMADPNVVTAITSAAGGLAGLTAGGTFTANAVPVPAAAWLFGSALMGLSVVRRRK